MNILGQFQDFTSNPAFANSYLMKIMFATGALLRALNAPYEISFDYKTKPYLEK